MGTIKRVVRFTASCSSLYLLLFLLKYSRIKHNEQFLSKNSVLTIFGLRCNIGGNLIGLRSRVFISNSQKHPDHRGVNFTLIGYCNA